jgi:predicted Fe-S protein YdhL (DUF1289 family)
MAVDLFLRGARRGLLTCSLLAYFSVAWAQAAAPNPLRAVGIFSLLGDSIQVVSSTDAPSDTRIERSARQTLDVPNIGFDNIAIRASRAALIKAAPQVKVELYKATTPMSLEAQRGIAEGAASGELPSWIVQTIQQKKLSHVLLVTRTRGPVDVRTGDGVSIGRGTVQGVGFYVDMLYTIKNTENGVLSTGLLAPYVQVRLTLMDTDTAAASSYDVRDSYALGSKVERAEADPWSLLSPTEKVEVLRTLLEDGMVRGMDALLKLP